MVELKAGEYNTRKSNQVTKVMSERNSCIIPKWESGQDNLRNFLDQLSTAVELEYFKDERDLIYTSLCNSGKSHVFQQLSQAQKTSIAEFRKFLNTNYGMSINERKRRFQTIQQKEFESENEFFLRTTQEYFYSKGINRPENTAFTSENKADISLAYISGLRNAQLKRVVRLAEDEIGDDHRNFFELGKRTQRKALSLRELESNVFEISENSILYRVFLYSNKFTVLR